MTKNLLRKYMDDHLTDDDLMDFERLTHKVKNREDEKKSTLNLKKARANKERYYDDV